VRALRTEGHDVLAVCEFRQRSVDHELMELAQTEGRILLTEDKDFGWLAFVAHMESPGVVLIRFPATARPLLASAIRQLIVDHPLRLAGSFVVLRPGLARFSRGPRQ
jgi:predicted nuclease of predicted toxin-antitoxin system